MIIPEKRVIDSCPFPTPFSTHVKEESHRYSTSIPVSYFPVSIASGAAFPENRKKKRSILPWIVHSHERKPFSSRIPTAEIHIFARFDPGFPSFAIEMGTAGMNKSITMRYGQISFKLTVCRMP